MKIFWGIVFFILGIAGVILPVLPGIPFFIISAFLFGIISEEQLIKGLKKFKIKDQKMAKWINKLINHIIIRYIHKRKFSL
ncbi:DUF454 family protein [Hydrogenothermus marinus]|uniref:Uncharacterized protein n=1 Tax=Hydrogenothermus marinus TaxID=133270 RepID=A0A3M0BIR7_9AQUI|nr:DUF454 family protein [Hydrogenothermus marinus]RMA97081.1 hypothetical protein CLV39_0735 [Hydrogenothermus marinus]